MSDYESEEEEETTSCNKKIIEEEEEDEFELQLRQEALEKERVSAGHGKTRTDEDGTVMEWDAERKAWFPKIDNDFIAQYQMNYGSNVDNSNSNSTSTEIECSSNIKSNQSYEEWFQEYYKQAGNNSYVASLAAAAATGAVNKEEATGDNLAYYEFYDYYYKYYMNAIKGNTGEATTESSSESNIESNSEIQKDNTSKMYEDFYAYWGLHGKSLTNDDEDKSEEKAYANAWSRFCEGYQTENTEKNDGEPAEKKKKSEKPQSWFELDESNNCNVYVTGLPEDVTDEEFHQLMSRCGMILNDIRSNKPKMKLYKNNDGTNKGDGLCCYFKKESVKLAIDMLDEYDVRGYKINVDAAKFELKGEFNPKKRGKGLSNKEKKKLKEKQEKLFDWRPEQTYTRKKHEKMLIVKNLFQVEDFEKSPPLILVMKTDLQTECAKYGEVKKVIIYDNHKDGVASVTFSSPEEADLAKSSLDGRLFKGKSIQVETYDGITKYAVEETEEQRTQRLAEWQRYLQSAENAASASAIAKDSNSISNTQPSPSDEHTSSEPTSSQSSKLEECSKSENSEPTSSQSSKLEECSKSENSDVT